MVFLMWLDPYEVVPNIMFSPTFTFNMIVCPGAGAKSACIIRSSFATMFHLRRVFSPLTKLKCIDVTKLITLEKSKTRSQGRILRLSGILRYIYLYINYEFIIWLF